MLTFVNKGTWLVENSQKGAYVIYEWPPTICGVNVTSKNCSAVDSFSNPGVLVKVS